MLKLDAQAGFTQMCYLRIIWMAALENFVLKDLITKKIIDLVKYVG